MDEKQERPDLSLFMASAAHDMKNSVSMLSGMLDAILKDAGAKELPAYRQLAHMLYETKRLNNNLIQLLALYKAVGSSSYPYDPQMQSIEQFVAEVGEQNRTLFESKSIAFETDFPADLIWCFDEDLVRGVVGHALNNAIHYTHDRVRLVVRESGDFLEIRVEDNGKGFPPAMLEAGSAIDRGVDFSTGSTGLGLYFSSEVARMHRHRGRVGGVALENGGTWGGGCFVLRLP